MKKHRLDARMIAIMGLLIALMVTLSRLVAIETPFIKISVTFIPQVIMGILFGPFWSGIGAVLADLVGMALFSKSAFFIGFTLNAFIEGAIYGFFFYRKEITWKNAILCHADHKLIFDTIMACVDVPCAIVQLGRLGAPPAKNSDMVTDSINCHLLRRT